MENPLDSSSVVFGNAEDEHCCFSYTPLCDSSKHKDFDKHLEFSDLGYPDLFTSSSDHDVDSIIVSMYETLVYDDISVSKVKTPQNINAL